MGTYETASNLTAADLDRREEEGWDIAHVISSDLPRGSAHSEMTFTVLLKKRKTDFIAK